MATIKVKENDAWKVVSQNAPGNGAPLSSLAHNALYGKTAIFLGDSFCAGTTVGESLNEYGYGWGGLIGEANNMKWLNCGVNGATITKHSGSPCILDQVDTAYNTYTTADYILFEGGANDADKIGVDSIGTFNAVGYSPSVKTDFTNAFETLILDLITKYPSAKIGYIVPHKAWTSNYNASNSDDYSANHIYRIHYDRGIKICEKWGIPVVDVWKNNPMNPSLSIYNDYYSEEAGKGKHLTLKGYQQIASQIECFMRSM